MPPSTTALQACRAALHERFRRIHPDNAIDANGYVNDPSDNLLEGISLSDCEAELRQGDGNELQQKFRAIHSSSALAVNNFAPFKSDPAALQLPQGGDFSLVCLEKKCPHGLPGRRPPNLDVVAESPDKMLAIESKCLEPLTEHKAEFASIYLTEIKNRSAWYSAMLRLVEAPRSYLRLDAAQLIKHAFGIANTFPGRRATLLYLYWEPCNPDRYPVFAEHRTEIDRFARAVDGAEPEFVAMSYPEVWAYWEIGSSLEWLRSHVRRLKARYGVTI